MDKKNKKMLWIFVMTRFSSPKKSHSNIEIRRFTGLHASNWWIFCPNNWWCSIPILRVITLSTVQTPDPQRCNLLLLGTWRTKSGENSDGFRSPKRCWQAFACPTRMNPIGSMYGIYTYIWLIFMVNVAKYTIHGYYGNGIPRNNDI